jgi:xanthine dehydrogenase molybdenum-binding subunit
LRRAFICERYRRVSTSHDAREEGPRRVIQLHVNGVAHRVAPRPGESLLVTLRERCGIDSLKDGCRPQGQCGACAAIVDGNARVTCTLPAERADGAEIFTLEGLSPEQRVLCARAFAAAGGSQCGFCIPGIALHATALLRKNPSPTRAEVKKALDLHLCRCTGYVKILDAIDLYARGLRGESIPAPLPDGGVGKPVSRAGADVSPIAGRPYVADLRREGLLHGVVLLSPHARARVESIDTRAASAMPGVVAVVTAADVPGDRIYGIFHRDWPAMIAVGEEVRCASDVLAAVAAESEAEARAALATIAVTYTPLAPTLEPEEALRESARRINPHHDNLLSRSIVRRGDVDAAFAASAHVVSEVFHTQRIEHLFLEPESCLAEPLSDGRLHVVSQGQGVFDDRRQIAALLAEPEDRVYVELAPTGGAFGGKEDLSIQAHAALLARKTGRPVRVTLSRDESVRMHPKRHPMRLAYAMGCDTEGRLTAVRARILGDSGAYASVGGKVLERAAGHACGPYRVAAVDIESIAVYTNNPPCGAMRGFGVNQTSFAVEGCLDRLAAKVGIDGWEMRFRNIVRVGDALATGQVLGKSVGLERTLLVVKDAYDTARREGRAVGVACGYKNAGLGNGVVERAGVRLAVAKEAPFTVDLVTGFTEMGQGHHQVLAQMASEITGLPSSLFRPITDTTAPVVCGQTTGSRATLLGGHAAIAAAEKLRDALRLVGASSGPEPRATAERCEETLAHLASQVFDGETVIDDTTAVDLDPPVGQPIKTHTTYGFATQVAILDAAGRVEKLIAAHDVGRAINPLQCAGQIEGAVCMGLGYALTEELPCPDGFPADTTMRGIGALRAADMPEIEVILIEEPEPEGPFGAKGVGEIGLVPTAGAVAAALAAFEGKYRDRLPMKDSAAARATTAGRYAARRKQRREDPR